MDMCNEVEARLATGEALGAELAAHREGCAACAATERAYAAVRRAYRELPADGGGAALADRVMEAAAAEYGVEMGSHGAAASGGSAATAATILTAARAELEGDAGAKGHERAGSTGRTQATERAPRWAWLAGAVAAALALWFGLRGEDSAPEVRPRFATASEALEAARQLIPSEPLAALDIYEGIFSSVDWERADRDLALSSQLRTDLQAMGYLESLPDQDASTSLEAETARLRALGYAGTGPPQDLVVAREPNVNELAQALEAAAFVHAFSLGDLEGAVVLIHRLNFDFPQYENILRTLEAEARWLVQLGQGGAALETIAELQTRSPDALEELRSALVQSGNVRLEDLGYSTDPGAGFEANMEQLGYMGYL